MGLKIREIRKEKRMSQDELASKSGVSRTIISRLETGEQDNATMKTLAKLATTLDVQVQDLFFDELV